MLSSYVRLEKEGSATAWNNNQPINVAYQLHVCFNHGKSFSLNLGSIRSRPDQARVCKKKHPTNSTIRLIVRCRADRIAFQYKSLHNLNTPWKQQSVLSIKKLCTPVQGGIGFTDNTITRWEGFYKPNPTVIHPQANKSYKNVDIGYKPTLCVPLQH